MKRKLTANEAAFVREYLVDLSQAAAARRAGFSERTAKTQGHQLMQRPHVKAAIQEAMDARAEKTGITAEVVLEGIERIAAKAEKTKDWHAALKGHELLGKHLKLFTDKVEHAGPGGGPILTATINPEKLSKEQLRAIASIRVDGE